jgi:chloride channel protein, CIC family
MNIPLKSAIAFVAAIAPNKSPVPDRLRALVRGSEIWIIGLAALTGVVGGLVVAVMSQTANILHRILFNLDTGDRLSAVGKLLPWPAVVVPVAGGVVLGLIGLAIQRYRPRRIVDPIEANALHGGAMSVRDSLIVAIQTLVSNGFGASVGLEAGYTQMVSGLASRLGAAFRLRRADLRVLVGCGAAAAIAAAFGAPLTGAFYAFELIIGAYTAASLAPVLTASIVAVVVSHAIGAEPYSISVGALSRVNNVDLPNFLLLALLCAGLGIAMMRGVTLAELAFRRSRLPTTIQPMLGGLIVGGLALVNPHVLSSGHGALKLTLDQGIAAAGPIFLLLVLKATASAISLGSGFRGGLFFASLFIGALAGKFYALVAFAIAPGLAPDPLVATIIGMSATAVAIVGGPLTMSFLALETTGDLPVTLAVLAAAIVSSVTVRALFGYSFATWKLHQRGETIRSAHDVGRIRALTVGRLMRRDVRTVRAETRVSTFRRDFPLGSTQRVVITDNAGNYAGIAIVAEIHALEINGEAEQRTVSEFAHWRQDALQPSMNIKDAMKTFDRTESEALAVVEGGDSRQAIGLLSEAHALRRYSEELDRARRDLVGEGA